MINATYKKGDKINYSDAMPVICIDLETTILQNEQKWTVRREGDKKKFDTQSVRSGQSRAKSFGQPNFQGKTQTINYD